MTVSTIAHPNKSDFVSVLFNDGLLSVVERMVAARQNAAVVVDRNGMVVGILTDHDVMHALAKNRGQLDGLVASEWMTENVITCSSDTRLSEALRLMGRNRIRHIVAVDGERPVGIIGSRDVLSKMHQNDEMEINVLRDMAIAHGPR